MDRLLESIHLGLLFMMALAQFSGCRLSGQRGKRRHFARKQRLVLARTAGGFPVRLVAGEL